MGDDDWDNIPEFEKAKNLILPIPSGDKKYFKIPMPLGFNILPNIGRSIAEMAYYQDRIGERIADLALAFTDSLNPLGGNSALSTVMPSVLDPAVELYANRDAFGKSIYREDFSGLAPTPGHSRARDNTAAPWVMLSEAINWITGGDADKPGMASPPPEALSYLFGVAFGGVARETNKAASFIGNLFDGTETPPYQIPMASRFYGEAGGDAATRSKYYDAIKDINIANLQRKGRASRGEDIPQDVLRVAALRQSSNAIQKNVKNLQDMRREAQSREEKKRLDQEIVARQRMMVERYRAVREAA
jgi:hypothetical protein